MKKCTTPICFIIKMSQRNTEGIIPEIITKLPLVRFSKPIFFKKKNHGRFLKKIAKNVTFDVIFCGIFKDDISSKKYGVKKKRRTRRRVIVSSFRISVMDILIKLAAWVGGYLLEMTMDIYFMHRSANLISNRWMQIEMCLSIAFSIILLDFWIRVYTKFSSNWISRGNNPNSAFYPNNVICFHFSMNVFHYSYTSFVFFHKFFVIILALKVITFLMHKMIRILEFPNQ